MCLRWTPAPGRPRSTRAARDNTRTRARRRLPAAPSPPCTIPNTPYYTSHLPTVKRPGRVGGSQCSARVDRMQRLWPRHAIPPDASKTL